MTIAMVYALNRVGGRSMRACVVADVVGVVIVTVAAIALVLTTRVRSRRRSPARYRRVQRRPRRVRLVNAVPDDDGVLLGYADEPGVTSAFTGGSGAPEIVGTVFLRLDPSRSSTMKMLDRWQLRDVTLVLLPSPNDELVEIHESPTAPAILVSQVKAP